jgi:hypothetical protein
MANTVAARMNVYRSSASCFPLLDGSLELVSEILFGRVLAELRKDEEIIRDVAKTLLHSL